MANILVNNNFYISTSSACIINIVPPVFSGINFLDVESRGQIRAGWTAGTDANNPIRYEVYIQVNTATGLFNTTNIAGITDKLQLDIFTLADGSFLQNGSTYYVGVRAVDAVGNRDANLVSLNVISTAILTAIDLYQTDCSFSIDRSNNFRLTMWANKNSGLAKSPTDVLGTASFQVYDKLGVAISGMSGTGISANAEGLFVATGVASSLIETSEHYEIKVTVSVDGENRVNFIKTNEGQSWYRINGTGNIDNTGNLIGSFWITENEIVRTTQLGSGSYQIYTADGTLILGFSESGITPDAAGFFKVTPLGIPPSVGIAGSAYIARYTITIDGIERSSDVIFEPGTTTYTCRAAFSINASNQLEASFWSTVNDELTNPIILGTASYQVYDKLGNIVSGLAQTGITGDAQGIFHTTPVSAALLTDLTHYVAKITIDVGGIPRTVIKGFTLLGN